jgi:hypothetical protein
LEVKIKKRGRKKKSGKGFVVWESCVLG